MNQSKFRVARINNPEDPKLLDFYNNVLEKVFTDKNDLDSLEEIQNFMELYNSKNTFYEVLVLLFDDYVIGGSIFGVFKCDGFCFIKGEYTGINKQYRKNGAFNYLMSKRIELIEKKHDKFKCEKIDFILNELISPNMVSENKNSVSKILNIWKMRGYKKIDFNFIQLPLNNSKVSISHFDLYILPVSEKYRNKKLISKTEMKTMIDACQTFRTSDNELNYYKEYQNMMMEINQKRTIKICKN